VSFFRKKKLCFKCPICECDYRVKIDPSEFTKCDYQYRKDTSIITIQKCNFCKVVMTVVLSQSGIIKAFDDKWEQYEKEYDEKTKTLEDQIAEFEDILEDNPNDHETKIKLKKLQKEFDKMEDSYCTKSDKYEDRKLRWQEKREDKFGA